MGDNGVRFTEVAENVAELRQTKTVSPSPCHRRRGCAGSPRNTNRLRPHRALGLCFAQWGLADAAAARRRASENPNATMAGPAASVCLGKTSPRKRDFYNKPQNHLHRNYNKSNK